ncbi:MAG: thymidine phosphorylase [Bdellovibrionota bacterium]
MLPVAEIIRKKREGLPLNSEELGFLVTGFASGSIPDYQVSAWLMASFLCGMDREETFVLTTLMRNSGKTLDWRKLSSNFQNTRFADKHSTGGVGDKVSLILAPLAACLGLKVPMMSGRGLGHTGGTVDKLESIPGFSMRLDEKSMIRCLDEVGVCMMSQSSELCPADRKLYSLRDVTATIESVPLITASIVSKKWAEGIDAIVYDVKCGQAAFMSTLDKAEDLSRSLVRISKKAGLEALACVTRMEEPLGSYIGNAMEVEESVWILKNQYPSELHKRVIRPLRQLCIDLTSEMAVLAGTRDSMDKARADCETAITHGQAYAVFEKMLKAQGAHENWFEALPRAKHQIVYEAPSSGIVLEIFSRKLGVLGVKLGIGREKSEDKVDPAIGFEILVRPGDTVSKGAPLLKLHAHSADALEKIREELDPVFLIENHPEKIRVLGSLAQNDSLLMERIEE